MLGSTIWGGSAAASSVNPRNPLWSAVTRAVTKKRTVGFTSTYQIVGGISASYRATISATGITQINGFDSEFQLTLPTVGTIRAIYTNRMVYEQLPPSDAARIPGHKPWVAARLPASLTSVSDSFSPRPLLALLEQQSDTFASAVPFGTATIRAVNTIGFKAYLNVPAAARNSKGEVAASLKNYVSTTHSKILLISVWLDQHNLVRRMAMTVTIPSGAPLPSGTTTDSSNPFGFNVQTATTSPTVIRWSMDLYNYGAKASFTPPPSSRVFIE